ncbi:MAG: MtN3 and saliva related transrane protein [Massilia sp.]|jgi:MtN3 and saliva related transmembrane protein
MPQASGPCLAYPQRQRHPDGDAMGIDSAFCFGVFLWLCYGVAIEAWPIAINNAITLVLASSVLLMKWRFEREGRRRQPSR